MGNKRKTDKTSIQVDNSIHSKAKEYCNLKGFKLSAFVEKAILEKLEYGK